MTDLLMLAVRYLAGVCDGARLQDGHGFNKLDTEFGHDLAVLAAWTPRQRRAAWEITRKYRHQLAQQGINWDSILEPPYTQSMEKPRTLTLREGRFELRFSYNAALIDVVKLLPGTRFSDKNPQDKYWRAPASRELQAFAEANKFIVSPEAQQQFAQLDRNLQESRAEEAELEIPNLRGTLRLFQKAGVQYALRAQRVLIADEMGLGKTIEALATIEAAKAYPAIVVCPATLKSVWKRHVKSWLPHRSVQVLGGREPESISAVDITIINYDVLGTPEDKEKKRPASGWIAVLSTPKAVVFDESHFCKNYKARRTKACKALAASVPLRLLLTGTPVLNRPAELISQLQILDRLNDMGGFQYFARHYCGWEPGLGMQEAHNLPELATALRSACMIRRTKKEVLKELPSKAPHAIVPMELNNREEYCKAERDIVGWIEEHEGFEKASAAERAEQLVRIEKLKQLVAKGKLPAVKLWIENFLESDEKLVIFANHIEIQKALLKHFPDSAHILGEDSSEKRQENVSRFQEDPSCKLVICSLATGGLGITLTAAKNVAFVELGWTDAIMQQATDRLHRIGQEGIVTPWYLLAEGSTIEDDIYNLIEEKREIAEGIAGGTETAIINDLVKRLANRKKK